jgi:hypothetical protein
LKGPGIIDVLVARELPEHTYIAAERNCGNPKICFSSAEAEEPWAKT